MDHASAVCSCVKAAVASRQQSESHIVVDLRHGCLVISNELRTVKADEAFLRSSPYVTVGRLRQRVDRALRKALIDAPCTNDVLIE